MVPCEAQGSGHLHYSDNEMEDIERYVKDKTEVSNSRFGSLF